MAYTFTIGTQVYASLGSTDGQYAIFMPEPCPVYELDRFHPPGITGNYIGRKGQVGGRITAVMLYVGTLVTIQTSINAAISAWANTAVSITTPGAKVYSKCNLIPDSLRYAGPETGIAAATAKAMIHVTAEFNIDGGLPA
jgi:hypothetical protein